MRLPYLPGQNTKLGWDRENYTEARWQKFKILTDLAYAASFGFLHTRMPTPGEFLNPEAAEERAKRVQGAWQLEAKVRSEGQVGLPVSEFPQEAKLYLLERIKDIPSGRRPNDGEVQRLIERIEIQYPPRNLPRSQR